MIKERGGNVSDLGSAGILPAPAGFQPGGQARNNLSVLALSGKMPERTGRMPALPKLARRGVPV